MQALNIESRPRALRNTNKDKATMLNTITHEQFLRLSENPIIRDTLARYDRGDIDYIQALERIAVNLLTQIERNK